MNFDTEPNDNDLNTLENYGLLSPKQITIFDNPIFNIHDQALTSFQLKTQQYLKNFKKDFNFDKFEFEALCQIHFGKNIDLQSILNRLHLVWNNYYKNGFEDLKNELISELDSSRIDRRENIEDTTNYLAIVNVNDEMFLIETIIYL